MTLSFGRQQLAIPGPTNVPDEVLQAMHRPAVDIYAGEVIDLTARLYAQLRRVFRAPEAEIYLYVSNGHGAWEAAIANTLSRGDKVLVLESGRFAIGWGETAAMLGAVVEALPAAPSGAIDPAALEARLRADAAHEIKAILAVQIDTASGVVNDIPALRRAIDAAGHPALLMIDAVASLGCMPFEMADWGVDLAMTGSQKGLMTPPGLGFVAAGPRAIAAHASADMRTQYWDWTYRKGEVFYQQFGGTPPEHLMFALDRALAMLLDEEGLEASWRRHALLAEATRRAAAIWAEGGAVSFNIPDPAARSATVTTLVVDPAYVAQDLRDYAREVCGLTVSLGLGPGAAARLRIAHMGHVNAPMMLGALGSIEMGMRALGWRIGEGGTAAAIAYLAAETARPGSNRMAAE